MVKVLFVKEVENVAQPGEIKQVRNGFARNYLLPKGIAVAATEDMLRRHQASIDAERKRLASHEQNLRSLAGALADKSVSLVARAGRDGRLYGSVTAQDIAAALSGQHRIEIDRRAVYLKDPIRRIGDYSIEIRLRRDITQTISLTVQSESSEALAQAE
jgi:large subunit ribosomal protein L9